MNNNTLDYLMKKMESRRGDRRDYKGGYEGTHHEDYRGSKGNVDFEGSMDFRRDSRSDMRDYNYDTREDARDYRDMRDYRDGSKMRLSKTDIHHWKQMMENEDGTRGPHYDMQQIMQAVEKLDIRFDEYSEREFCMAVNTMYSDYCKVAKRFVAPDKEMMFFAELAKAFLDDADGPEPSEKLALYYHCIVDA
jgi:hypothetical protein